MCGRLCFDWDTWRVGCTALDRYGLDGLGVDVAFKPTRLELAKLRLFCDRLEPSERNIGGLCSSCDENVKSLVGDQYESQISIPVSDEVCFSDWKDFSELDDP